MGKQFKLIYLSIIGLFVLQFFFSFLWGLYVFNKKNIVICSPCVFVWIVICRLVDCYSGEHGYREEMEEERIEYFSEANPGTLTTTGLEHFKFIRIQEKELRRRETGKK